METRYLIDYDKHLQSKNKLHDAIDDFFKGLHRSMVTGSEIKSLESRINKQIERCNTSYPRCQPVKPERFKEQHGDWIMHVNHSMFIMKLYKVRQ